MNRRKRCRSVGRVKAEKANATNHLGIRSTDVKQSGRGIEAIQMAITEPTREGLLRHPAYLGVSCHRIGLLKRRVLLLDLGLGGRARGKNKRTPVRRTAYVYAEQAPAIHMGSTVRACCPVFRQQQYAVASRKGAISPLFLSPMLIGLTCKSLILGRRDSKKLVTTNIFTTVFSVT